MLNCFPQKLNHFTFPIAIYKCSGLSTFFPTLVISHCYIKKKITILVGMKRYFIVVLICIFLVTNNVERLFMCLLAICISSLIKCVFKSSALLNFFNLYSLNHESFKILWILDSYQIHDLQIFFPFCGLPIHFLDNIL